MIGKNIDQVTKEDLQSLIDNSVLEDKTTEYKQSLPGNSNSEKTEFLADVSSFANASGGDLIFGIVEVGGEPRELEGMNIQNVDQEIGRLDSIIRSGIRPRIPSIRMKPIDLSNGKNALVIRIPRSWISPHRIVFKGHDKFYSRSSNGKYPLDVGELRTAFTLSETITERIRKFREDRISSIFANETPIPFYQNAKIVLHLIPVISFNPAQAYDIDSNIGFLRGGKMSPMNSRTWSHRYNFDGFLTYSAMTGGRSHSYVQLYRNGIIEAVEGLLLKPHKDQLVIPSVGYERKLIRSLTDYVSVLEKLGIEPPIFVFLTLLGVKDYILGVDQTKISVPTTETIDRDVLLLPENVIRSYTVKADEILRPCFDSVWNACGFPRSMNYNQSGAWVGH